MYRQLNSFTKIQYAKPLFITVHNSVHMHNLTITGNVGKLLNTNYKLFTQTRLSDNLISSG